MKKLLATFRMVHVATVNESIRDIELKKLATLKLKVLATLNEIISDIERKYQRPACRLSA